MNLKTLIPANWQTKLSKEIDSDYFNKLSQFLTKEYKTEICFPPEKYIFRAFENCSFENTKVVILGQDPYHGDGQAHGLSFSVPIGVKFPPSLRNIFKELSSDMEIQVPFQGDLSYWTQQGVLLLNATLTVRKSEPGSHQKQGWEEFTDAVIRKISEEKENVVFILWGSYAQKKGKVIDSKKHLLIQSPHPSPLSSYRGFFGSKPFSKTNTFLKQKGLKEIDWELS